MTSRTVERPMPDAPITSIAPRMWLVGAVLLAFAPVLVLAAAALSASTRGCTSVPALNVPTLR